MMDRRISMTACCALLLIASGSKTLYAACEFTVQGEGHVSSVLDARTIRLADGRDVRLSGIEIADDATGRSKDALAGLIEGRAVTLRGPDDTPDRYGRQPPSSPTKNRQAISSTASQPGRRLRLAERSRPTVFALLAAEAIARRKARHLGWFGCLKKREKRRRYFVQTGTLYRGGRDGFVGEACWRDILCQFRTPMDTGLCRDYFKAHDGLGRGDRD